MPVPLIRCRNTETGAVAEIPQTALRHMTNWRPITDEADAGADGEKTAPEPQPAGAPAAKDRPATTSGKSKAAKATSTKEEE